LNTLESRIQAIEDRQQLGELRGHYCHVVDGRQWETLADLFTEDGEFIGFARARGRAEILSYFRDTVSEIADAFWHFCSNPTLKLNGDTATGLLSMHYMAIKNGVSYAAAGTYHDVMRRENGIWKFVRRKVTFDFFAPVTEGFTGQPPYIHVDGTPMTAAEFEEWTGT